MIEYHYVSFHHASGLYVKIIPRTNQPCQASLAEDSVRLPALPVPNPSWCVVAFRHQLGPDTTHPAWLETMVWDDHGQASLVDSQWLRMAADERSTMIMANSTIHIIDCHHSLLLGHLNISSAWPIIDPYSKPHKKHTVKRWYKMTSGPLGFIHMHSSHFSG